MHTTQQALSAFDAAVSEVGVRNVLLADSLRGAFVRRLDALGSAPDGWRLVPVEQTQEMTEVGAGVIDDNGGNARWSDIREAWAAMLAASPRPPATQPATVKDSLTPAAQQGEAVAPSDLRERIAAAQEAAEDGDTSGCLAILRETLRVLDAQPAAVPQPVAQGITNDDIRREFLAAGFTIKEGHTDLKPYVYEAARRVLALAAAPAGVVVEPRGWLLRWPKPGGGHTWLWQDGPDEPTFVPFPRVPLYTAPPARQALTDEQRDAVLLSVIQKLNSNPYSLTKSECISEVQSMRSSGIGG